MCENPPFPFDAEEKPIVLNREFLYVRDWMSMIAESFERIRNTYPDCIEYGDLQRLRSLSRQLEGLADYLHHGI
jgi:hypothetical protein